MGLRGGYERGRAKILEPFQPYYRYLGTWQSWRMFVAPHRYPARSRSSSIGGRGGSRLRRPILRARLDAAVDDHDRLRAATFRYGWATTAAIGSSSPTGSPGGAAVDFPEARRVRVSFVRHRTPSPAEVLGQIAPRRSGS